MLVFTNTLPSSICFWFARWTLGSGAQCHNVIMVCLYILHKNYIWKIWTKLIFRPQIAMFNIVQKLFMNTFVNDFIKYSHSRRHCNLVLVFLKTWSIHIRVRILSLCIHFIPACKLISALISHYSRLYSVGVIWILLYDIASIKPQLIISVNIQVPRNYFISLPM